MFESMRRHLKNYLIPHEGNGHKPHALREASVLALALIVLLLFGFSIFQAVLVRTNEEFLAAVVPAVLVDLANEDRTDDGLGELTVSPILEEAARMKAEDMAKNEYFAHVSPAGLEPWYWIYKAGYQFSKAGENLAVNFTDSKDVNRAWMNSPGHRANIMNAAFTEVGIAAVSGTYKGKKTIYIVQMFGTPSVVAEVASPRVSATPAPLTTNENVAGESASTETPKKKEVLSASAEPTQETVVEAPIRTAMYVQESVTSAQPKELPKAKTVAPVNEAPQWEEFLANPRAVVEWGYIAIGLLIALVMLLMVFYRVHKEHSKNMLYGGALLAIIVLLFYFNFLLLSADLLVV